MQKLHKASTIQNRKESGFVTMIIVLVLLIIAVIALAYLRVSAVNR